MLLWGTKGDQSQFITETPFEFSGTEMCQHTRSDTGFDQHKVSQRARCTMSGRYTVNFAFVNVVGNRMRWKEVKHAAVILVILFFPECGTIGETVETVENGRPLRKIRLSCGH